MKGMFKGNGYFNFNNVKNWNVSNFTDMSEMFSNVLNIDNPTKDASPINNWDVRKVANFANMFKMSKNQGTPSDYVYPSFTLRPGHWDNNLVQGNYSGTYVPIKSIDEMCPGCVYMDVPYSLSSSNDNYHFYTSWNTKGKTPTKITSGYGDYNTVKNVNIFLGLILNNETHEIDRAYACGHTDDDKIPFCVEGWYDNSKNSSNENNIKSLFKTRDENNDYVKYSSPDSDLTTI
jgi:hypothetical protein